MKSIVSVIAYSVLLCLAANAQTGSYNITDLGTFPGFTVCQAFGLNASGQVTGACSPNANSASWHAFLYSGGTITDLGTFGAAYSVGRSINDSGQITGDLGQDAFFYSGGAITNLGALGGTVSQGFGINNTGQVVGWAQIAGGNGIWDAFLSAPAGGKLTDLGTLGGGWGSQANAINTSGQVTGYAFTAAGLKHTFLYTAPGPMTDLGAAGGAENWGDGINNLGQVVGGLEVAGNTTSHAFLCIGGPLIDLGTLPVTGGVYSEAFAINDSRQVVGWSSLIGENDYRGFLYTQSGGMVDLNSLLPTGSGWTLWGGWAINNSGQIAGTGEINGQLHAFLMTPLTAVQQLTNSLTALVNSLNLPNKSLLLAGIQQLPTLINSMNSFQKNALKSQLQALVAGIQAGTVVVPGGQSTQVVTIANELINVLG